ncbi:sigma factor-like helix-turn-helix DNA-binding protein [Amycolatopsis rhabdoformis]|uniref:Sigma factor-like helix-turn-helix DNA-binding protein n=1 Tax=Amycolatopsis rhabdoformis TaxID=1448059 RepID=A0ABZ1IKP1_9PSEU|nr:sigma factor-like helix-turn-helix DNA-binding protein [Amycolatopsis rhabdoformis]WSE35099.1 sigma factor-like helix-turn-helix DNA-binding protein [Amycolatopsis rhabdoformis]
MTRLGVTPAPGEGHESRGVSAISSRGSLATALAKLPHSERDVPLLVALAQLDWRCEMRAEMAQALGISLDTVGSRLHRARQKLAPILAQEARDE